MHYPVKNGFDGRYTEAVVVVREATGASFPVKCTTGTSESSSSATCVG